jgi:hypothetical protein
MAFTGRLGTSQSVLGSTFALGFDEDPDPANQNVAQTFGFQSVATFNPVVNVEVNQRLFNGTDTVEALYREASNAIFATGSIASPDVEIDVVQYLGLTDRKFHDAGNAFSFKGVATIAVIVDASNFVFTNPSQNNKVIHAHLASNSFGWTLGQVLAASQAVSVKNEFGFVDAWTFDGTIFGQDVVQDGGGFLRQTVSISVDNNDCRELEYDPLIGEADNDGFDAFRITKPVFSTGTVEFTYPPTAPTNTLTLDDPDFGNSDTLNFTRIDRETRGGDRKIFADEKWSSWERLEMTVTGLQEIDADDIIDFLNASLGKKVRLTDWEGRNWEGFIVEPETDVVNRRSGWRLDLVFEAEITDKFVEHNEQTVTHNVNPGDDIVVTHNL